MDILKDFSRNEVTFAGRVGKIDVYDMPDDKYAFGMSICAYNSYQDKSGVVIYESVWMNATGFESEKIPLSILKQIVATKTFVEVKGAIRNQMYTDGEGRHRSVTSIKVSELKIIHQEK